MLLLLVTLAIALMRRRQVKRDDRDRDHDDSPQVHDSPPLGHDSLQSLPWPIWPTPRTPGLPMQTPPVSGVGPRSSFAFAFASRLGDARLDAGIVEKGQGYGVSNGHPFMDETRIKGRGHLVRREKSEWGLPSIDDHSPISQ
ncbi:hypothetical protein BGW80DRAFT_684727 [Lactifluus volemus]|nr:hypothetical protein BGW80DRAFT_684727 [Lactifluus volemus]